MGSISNGVKRANIAASGSPKLLQPMCLSLVPDAAGGESRRRLWLKSSLFSRLSSGNKGSRRRLKNL